MTQCLITGVVLYDQQRNAVTRGDLFRIGDCWLINCAFDRFHQVDWYHGEKPDPTDKVIAISPRCPPGGRFERGQTVVIHHDWAELNKAALDYMDA